MVPINVRSSKVLMPALQTAGNILIGDDAQTQSITPETQQDQLMQLKRFNVGEDCPVFDGLYSFYQTYAGGSVGGAVKLNHGHCDIAVNWAGGLHHAKKCEASGFC